MKDPTRAAARSGSATLLVSARDSSDDALKSFGARSRGWLHAPAVDFGLLFLMVLPSLVWILLGRGKWVSDTSFYGLNATRLHYALLHEPGSWWHEMLGTSPKPPILPWVGQFFVDLGRSLGNVDIGLLLAVLLAQYAALCFLNRALNKVLRRRSLALLGCLAVASAPMFIFLSTQFYVQPVQLLAVCWFLFIMVSSRAWDSLLTLSHLIAASGFAILATMSSPAYCAVPGAIALFHAWVNRDMAIRARRAHFFLALAAVVTASLAAAWYLRNLEEAVAYGRFGYSFSYGAEVRDVFLVKLVEWTKYVAFGFAFSAGFALLFPWALPLHRPEDGHRLDYEATVMLLIGIQIALSLLVVASSAHQTFRYVLPLVPYFAVVGSWSLSKIDKQWLTGTIAVAFVAQLVGTNLALYFWDDGRFLRERQSYVAALDAVTEATFGHSGDTVWLGIGELGVFNFDLAYHVAKIRGYRESDIRDYRSIEISLTNPEIDGDVDALWMRIESGGGTYVVLLREQPHSSDVGAPNDRWQAVIRGTHEISNRVRMSGRFQRVATPDSWDVEIYRDLAEPVHGDEVSHRAP